MLENWQPLILQLGISALVVLVGFKIAVKLIDKWYQSDSERTKTLATAEAARTVAIQEGFAADIEAHQSIVEVMHDMSKSFSRIEGKLDAVLDLTPIHGVRIDPSYDADLTRDDETPVMRKLPREESRAMMASPGLHGPKRPKTQG